MNEQLTELLGKFNEALDAAGGYTPEAWAHLVYAEYLSGVMWAVLGGVIVLIGAVVGLYVAPKTYSHARLCKCDDRFVAYIISVIIGLCGAAILLSGVHGALTPEADVIEKILTIGRSE